MTREEAVAQGQSNLADALGAVYDAGVQSVIIPPVVGADADEQAKIEAAVAQAVAPYDQKVAAMQADLDAKQADLDKALSDDASDKAQIEADQKDIAAKRAVLDQIAALAQPSPTV